MNHAAPAIFQALEASWFGAGVRQSVWLYPLANVTHVLAVVVFFACVAIMDVRLLGGFAATAPGRLIAKARTAAAIAFLVVAASGFLLFAAEASHLALNRVFQFKVALIALGLCNVLLFEWIVRPRVVWLAPGERLPDAARASALASLAAWLAIVICGRSIAYF
jgi:hypothetical protein